MMSATTRFSTHFYRFLGIVCLFCPLLFAACGSGTTPANAQGLNAVVIPSPSSTVTPPQDLKDAGKLTLGTDPSYIPLEYFDSAQNRIVGFDIDMHAALAAHMGLQPVVVKDGFDTLLDDLSNKRFDLVISAVSINPQREQSFDFVPYFQSGSSLLVPKGNPNNIKSVANLCGMSVGVQTGTVENIELTTASKQCQQDGKQPIQQIVLQTQTEVIQLLINGRVSATYQDSPVTNYYNNMNPGQFDIGGPVVNLAPYGIAIRKDDTGMLNAVKAAFSAMQKDGTYDKLFEKWGFSTAQKIS